MMWLCLLLVFVCSYGVFRQALFFANKEPYWGVINDLFYKPYWHVYGELFVEQMGGWPVTANKRRGYSGESVLVPLDIFTSQFFLLLF